MQIGTHYAESLRKRHDYHTYCGFHIRVNIFYIMYVKTDPPIFKAFQKKTSIITGSAHLFVYLPYLDLTT